MPLRSNTLRDFEDNQHAGLVGSGQAEAIQREEKLDSHQRSSLVAIDERVVAEEAASV